MQFEFATAGRIIFGPGAIKQIGRIVAEFGNSAFVATNVTADQAAPLLDRLTAHDISFITFTVRGEPTTDDVRRALEQARRQNPRCVIGIGGGSAMDTAKAVAAMLANPGRLEDYLEVVGAGNKLTRPAAPCITIPTTAGTGAEVTRNAVLAVPEKAVKVSLRSILMLPRVALVDPELTYSMPPAVTASTGLDALTQLMEAFVSNKANPLTDGICREGLVRAARSLKNAYSNPTHADARQDMSLASLFGGLALANAKLGAVHGFAGPLGGMIHAAHGTICAALLPHVMQTNVAALQQRSPGSPALARYDEIARILTGSATAGADDAVDWVRRLCSDLNVPPLAQLGLQPQDIPAAVARARAASSMKGNPIELTEQELTEILSCAL